MIYFSFFFNILVPWREILFSLVICFLVKLPQNFKDMTQHFTSFCKNCAFFTWKFTSSYTISVIFALFSVIDLFEFLLWCTRTLYKTISLQKNSNQFLLLLPKYELVLKSNMNKDFKTSRITLICPAIISCLVCIVCLSTQRKSNHFVYLLNIKKQTRAYTFLT